MRRVDFGRFGVTTNVSKAYRSDFLMKGSVSRIDIFDEMK